MLSNSSDEVDDNEMQDDAGKEKVGESAFRPDVMKVRFVLGIALNTQTRAQDEGAARVGKGGMRD